MIGNAWMWMSAKKCQDYANTVALTIGAPTNAAAMQALNSVPTTEHATISMNVKYTKLISSALDFARMFPDRIVAVVPMVIELAQIQGRVKVKTINYDAQFFKYFYDLRRG